MMRLERLQLRSFKRRKSNLIYSEYNIYTRTGRPSNSYAGINFAALNKDDGSRDMICSRFDDGILVEFDFNSYHMFLISKLINFKLPTTDIHRYLAEQMTSKINISAEEKTMMKQINFELLYSDIDQSIIDAVPFFNEIYKFRNELYHDFIKNGYIETYLFKRKLYMPKDSKLATVFNYYIQSFETEQNIIFIHQMNQYFVEHPSLKSKLILYTYDSFLFDFDKSELLHIPELMKLLCEFPLKVNAGYDYGHLTEIKIN